MLHSRPRYEAARGQETSFFAARNQDTREVVVLLTAGLQQTAWNDLNIAC